MGLKGRNQEKLLERCKLLAHSLITENQASNLSAIIKLNSNIYFMFALLIILCDASRVQFSVRLPRYKVWGVGGWGLQVAEMHITLLKGSKRQKVHCIASLSAN